MRRVRKKQLRSAAMTTAAFLLCLASTTRADPPPVTDSEVRAAYCIPVVQRQVQAQQSLLATLEKTLKDEKSPPAQRQQAETIGAGARQQLAKTQSALDRLQAAVRAHAPYPQDSPLADAQKRGASDIDAFIASTNTCASKCFSAGPSIDKCENQCEDKSLVARVKACLVP
jgi:hypothetical protein